MRKSVSRNPDVIFVQNIIAPYKTLLFHALDDAGAFKFGVVYLAKTARNREWNLSRCELRFSHDLIFDGNLEDASQFLIAINVYRFLSKNNPTVVILGGYSYLAFWAGLVWARINGKKVIVINESHYLDRRRLWFKETMKRLFITSCDAALVDGTRHKQYIEMLGLPAEKVFIKNGTGPIDLDRYRNCVSQHRKDKTKLCDKLGLRRKNFLFVGRFSPEKNVILLLDAYKRIKTNVAVDWGLILVGNGPQKMEIENYISKHEVKDVALPGFKEGEELCLFYALSDVFILPSISEPWGLVVNEALASDLPVIVSNRCGCFPDIVNDGVNGFSFDPTDERELLQRMSMFVQGIADAATMGRASREILAQYTPRKVAEAYCKAISFVQSNGKQ